MISIIIPVYNGEKYILRCYDSLVNQSLHDWEAIFINDGSTDRSLVFLKQLEQKDSRIKVFDKKNEGVAVAREYGINLSSYEIITFLDVDDTLESDALAKYIESFAAGIDIVISGFNIINKEGEKVKQINYGAFVCPSSEIINRLCDGRIRWQLWAKAFRKKTLVSTAVPYGIRNAEDMAVCMQALTKSDMVRVVDNCLYDYIQEETSVTHVRPQGIAWDALAAASFVEREIGEKLGKENIDCLFLLIISGALRGGMHAKDKYLMEAMSNHFRSAPLLRISRMKALNLLLLKLLRINLAKYI